MLSCISLFELHYTIPSRSISIFWLLTVQRLFRPPWQHWQHWQHWHFGGFLPTTTPAAAPAAAHSSRPSSRPPAAAHSSRHSSRPSSRPPQPPTAAAPAAAPAAAHSSRPSSRPPQPPTAALQSFSSYLDRFTLQRPLEGVWGVSCPTIDHFNLSPHISTISEAYALPGAF
jgi:hypothetical protein